MIAAVRQGVVQGVYLSTLTLGTVWAYPFGQWINGMITGHHGFYLH